MDTDHQVDLVWLLGIQRKLYQWSRKSLDEVWREMWNWATDLRNLKAGVLSEEQFFRTDAGTPQGGIISPLLADIVLSTIEERCER